MRAFTVDHSFGRLGRCAGAHDPPVAARRRTSPTRRLLDVLAARLVEDAPGEYEAPPVGDHCGPLSALDPERAPAQDVVALVFRRHFERFECGRNSVAEMNRRDEADLV